MKTSRPTLPNRVVISPRGVFKLGGILFLCTGLVAPQVARAQGPVVELGGFTQLTVTKTEEADAVRFGFDRVRLIALGKINPGIDYKLQVDFMKPSADGMRSVRVDTLDGSASLLTDKDGDTPGIIKDAEIGLKLGRNLKLRVGKFKTPIGMEFNTSGKRLDVIKRGLGQQLVFERNAGALLETQQLGTLPGGLALGIFNAGPNQATGVGVDSEGNYNGYTLAGRLSADPSQRLHGQVFFGSALTSLPGQERVTILGGGLKAVPVINLTAKAEYISREDGNTAAASGSDFYFQAGYQVTAALEAVLKYETLNVAQDSRDQTNLTVGLNLFLNPAVHSQSKIQINYVQAREGSGADRTTSAEIQVMVQAAF